MKRTKAQVANSLVERSLTEAVSGVMTAEKVPGGGDATSGGKIKFSIPGQQQDGGQDGEPESVEFMVKCCGKDSCDSVIQALKALKSAGADICCSKAGEDGDLCADKKEDGEDGGAGHEGGESAQHEKSEHENGDEKKDE